MKLQWRNKKEQEELAYYQQRLEDLNAEVIQFAKTFPDMVTFQAPLSDSAETEIKDVPKE